MQFNNPASTKNKKMKTKNMTTLHLRKSIGRSPLRLALLLIPLVLACFGLASGAQAALAEGSLGNGNTVEGGGALQSLTTGIHDTAIGYQTLFSVTDGKYNTAVGSQALKNNTANNNTAVGFQALVKNTTGANINAVGFQALFSNDGVPPQGSFNNAHGNFALFSNTTGRQNNAFGHDALGSNVTGSFNTAVGDLAGMAITKNWNIDIGKDVIGTSSDAFVTRIGISDPADPSGHVQKACFIGGIVNAPITGVGVVVSATGQLGVAPVSSARFKDEIKPMNKASEAVFALKPVTFHYKQEIDPKGIPQFGLVAEEVEKVNPALVTRDAKGEVYTVRYEAVNAMLLNEFLKEHRTVEEQKATIAELKSTVAQQQRGMEAVVAQLKQQASQIKKVSAQVEMSRPAPQMVGNNQ